MQRSDAGPRLIILCGLPGSGKTTLAERLEGRLRAVRFSPDEWMGALSLDLGDEERRGKIEALQWEFDRQILALLERFAEETREKVSARLNSRSSSLAIGRRRGLEHGPNRRSEYPES